MDRFTGLKKSDNRGKHLKVNACDKDNLSRDSGIDTLPSPSSGLTSCPDFSSVVDPTQTELARGPEHAKIKTWVKNDLCCDSGISTLPSPSSTLPSDPHFSSEIHPTLTKPILREGEFCNKNVANDDISDNSKKDSKLQETGQLNNENILETIFQQDKDGDTFLHLYASRGNTVAVQKILELKPDLDCINLQNNYHQTALHILTAVGSASGVEQMLHYGADVELVDLHGNTIWHIAAQKEKSFILKVIYSLYKSAKKIVNDSVRDALRRALNKKNYEGLSPIHLAVKFKRKEAVQLLLEAGADVNDRDYIMQSTPLHYAAWMGDATLVTELIYSRRAMVSPMAQNGATPLHYAIGNGHAAVVALLLGAGANADDMTFEGDTARSYANTKDVLMVLREVAIRYR